MKERKRLKKGVFSHKFVGKAVENSVENVKNSNVMLLHMCILTDYDMY